MSGALDVVGGVAHGVYDIGAGVVGGVIDVVGSAGRPHPRLEQPLPGAIGEEGSDDLLVLRRGQGAPKDARADGAVVHVEWQHGLLLRVSPQAAGILLREQKREAARAHGRGAPARAEGGEAVADERGREDARIDLERAAQGRVGRCVAPKLAIARLASREEPQRPIHGECHRVEREGGADVHGAVSKEGVVHSTQKERMEGSRAGAQTRRSW